MTKGNAFLLERNVQSKINSASAILCQQPEINFSASDIVELNLSESQLYEALKTVMSDPTVAAVKTAHLSNVNVVTTKASPSFHGVITSGEVDKLVKYSNLLGMEYVNLRSLRLQSPQSICISLLEAISVVLKNPQTVRDGSIGITEDLQNLW
jgi:hypothetical protein